jgi:hypothetical protein
MVSSHWDSILNTIEWFLSIQLPSGNWPHKASQHTHTVDPYDDELVQYVTHRVDIHSADAILVGVMVPQLR